MIEIIPYNSNIKLQWDLFVDEARNGHFFFKRSFMEYHSDRFLDASLVFKIESKIVSLLPASRKESIIECHGGLTFGYLLIDKNMTVTLMIQVFEVLKVYLKNLGINSLIYKPAPYIFHQQPSQEDLYCLFRFDAQLFRRDVSSAIDFTDPLKYQERRIRGVRKARNNKVEVRQSEELIEFWDILSVNLDLSHRKKPIHTVQEIITLRDNFPNNIKLFVAKLESDLLAGVLIFENPTIVHAQYIASSELGRSMGALDLTFDFIISHYSKSKRFFSFGISTENQAKLLNEGLVSQKEGFGARTITHDFYSLQI